MAKKIDIDSSAALAKIQALIALVDTLQSKLAALGGALNLGGQGGVPGMFGGSGSQGGGTNPSASGGGGTGGFFNAQSGTGPLPVAQSFGTNGVNAGAGAYTYAPQQQAYVPQQALPQAGIQGGAAPSQGAASSGAMNAIYQVAVNGGTLTPPAVPQAAPQIPQPAPPLPQAPAQFPFTPFVNTGSVPQWTGAGTAIAYGGARAVGQEINYNTERFIRGGDDPMGRAGVDATWLSFGVGAIAGLATGNVAVGIGAERLSNAIFEPMLKALAAPEANRQSASRSLAPFFSSRFGAGFRESQEYTGAILGYSRSDPGGFTGQLRPNFDIHNSRLSRLVNRTDRQLGRNSREFWFGNGELGSGINNAAPILGAIGSTLFDYGIDPFAPGELVHDPEMKIEPPGLMQIQGGGDAKDSRVEVRSSAIQPLPQGGIYTPNLSPGVGLGLGFGGGGQSGGGGVIVGGGGGVVGGALGGVSGPVVVKRRNPDGSTDVKEDGVHIGTIVREPDRSYQIGAPAPPPGGGGLVQGPYSGNVAPPVQAPGEIQGGAPVQGGGYSPPPWPLNVGPLVQAPGKQQPPGRNMFVLPAIDVPVAPPVQAPGYSPPRTPGPMMPLSDTVPGGDYQENRMETYFRRTGILFGRDNAAEAWKRIAPGFDPYLGGNTEDEPGNIADVLHRLGPTDTLAYLRIHHPDLDAGVDPELLRKTAGALRRNDRALTLGSQLPMGTGAAEKSSYAGRMATIAGLPDGVNSIEYAKAYSGFRTARMEEFGQETLSGFGLRDLELQGRQRAQEYMPFGTGNPLGTAVGIVRNNAGQIGRLDNMLKLNDLSERERYEITSQRQNLIVENARNIGNLSEGMENLLPALSAGRPRSFGMFDSSQIAAMRYYQIGAPQRGQGAVNGQHAQRQQEIFHDLTGGSISSMPYSRTEGINNGGATEKLTQVMTRVAEALERQGQSGGRIGYSPTQRTGESAGNALGHLSQRNPGQGYQGAPY